STSFTILRRTAAISIRMNAPISLKPSESEMKSSTGSPITRFQWSRVALKLVLQWSPEQISGWLKRQFPAAPGMQISHETIYRSLFIQTRGVLKKALMAQLRTTRQMRQAKGGTTKSGLGQIVDAASIRERPAEADDRAVPGHWEGDLLSGANNTHIATLVER